VGGKEYCVGVHFFKGRAFSTGVNDDHDARLFFFGRASFVSAHTHRANKAS